MGSFASCDDSVSVSNGFRSCFYSLDSEEFCVKLEQSSPNSTKKNVNEVFFEDLDSSTSEEEDFNDSIVKELGISLCATLHIHEHPGSLGVGNPALNQDNICKQMEIKPASFDTDVPKGLSKCAPIQCSELVQSYPVNSDADGLLRTIVINENDSKAQNLAFVQQLHLACGHKFTQAPESFVPAPGFQDGPNYERAFICSCSHPMVSLLDPRVYRAVYSPTISANNHLTGCCQSNWLLSRAFYIQVLIDDWVKFLGGMSSVSLAFPTFHCFLRLIEAHNSCLIIECFAAHGDI